MSGTGSTFDSELRRYIIDMDGFHIEMPAEYPECYIARAFRGMPESDGDEERLDECSMFAADRIEHSFAKRI